ncbi:unnamed protein product [Arctia plantaginis]|uniref:Uncharacterized protein n=1 Tax=Arctia plantaginis TaxID=874455 RepID=A0A8S1AAJ7_ARCPL|nr:unnamed protein product [Arctia plantaginis]
MEKIDDSSTISIVIEEENQPDRTADVVPTSISDEENQNDKTYVPDNSSSDTDDSYADTVSSSPGDGNLVHQQCEERLPEKRVRRKPDFYSADMCVDISDDGISFSDAISGHEKEQWQCAMKEELKSFQENDTWELVDRPKDLKRSNSKGLYSKKRHRL